MNNYREFIFKSRYARWLDDKQRRETWEETVGRYIKFFVDRFPELLITDNPETISLAEDLFADILDMKVMPSMRALMMAGKALEEHNVSGYNCAYVAIDHQKVFSEILYILCCGTGVGFSCEERFINKLPEIPDEFYNSDTVIVVSDSKIGWAKSLKEVIGMLYAGQIPKWDLSRVRPKGARLKTTGGRASGPGPLADLFEFAKNTFLSAKGRKLNSLEVHDIVCKLADVVVVGGVRRSALISLSDIGNNAMAKCKTGQWWTDNPQRALANNSAVYTSFPDIRTFLDEWVNLYDSKAGERGIFSRDACKKHLIKNVPRRNSEYEFGCNPCSEIILRNKQFCNLTEVVIRENDTVQDVKSKIRIAVILGTLQSTLTDFKFLSKEWKTNCEEERLLGVSFTGIMDNPLFSKVSPELENILKELRDYAIDVNKEFAAKLGIMPSCAVTCIKPSGTVSQLVDSSSGVHPRYSKYYIRRVRNDKKDPISLFLIEQGIPYHEDPYNSECWVFEFPQKSPTTSVLREEITALQQLELWRTYAEYWCEHKPSCTVYYSDSEFLDVGAWVLRHFDSISGISFLPRSDHSYKSAPYEEITKEQYEQLSDSFPNSTLNWDDLSLFEKEDTTKINREYACSGDKCDII